MSNKHEANVRKGTFVNFQIGLVASLLFTYLMFEVYTSESVKDDEVVPVAYVDEAFVWDGQYQVYQDPVEKVVVQKQSIPIVEPQEFEVIDDGEVVDQLITEFKSVDVVVSKSFDSSEINDVKEDTGSIEFPFSVVEDVPVFPGCEKLKTNKEKAACFSEKIGRIISKKFNTDIGGDYGLHGVQRIYALFDVAVDGSVKNIQIRAPHPKLKKEAERVIKLIPDMTPGMQRKVPVTVKYQLPIVFKVQD